MTEKTIPSLWKHQENIVQKARGKKYFALFADPGTGKTATTITILREIYKSHGMILPTLIVCPPVVIGNWSREFDVWSKIDKKSVIEIRGSGKQRAKLISTTKQNSILITNYETLPMKDCFEPLQNFLNQSIPSIIVLDEAHKIKDASTKRARAAIALGDSSDYRYILTGTPILNDLMDIFGQFRFLDKGERFGLNLFSFRARYFEDKNAHMPRNRYFPNWQPIKGADRVIKSKMADVSEYVDKATCLTLPPFVKKRIEVEMSPEQARLYESMKKDLVATMSDVRGEHVSIAELAITKALRLQQIVSGHLRVESDAGLAQTIQLKDNPRKNALRDILEDLCLRHKVLVWGVFKANFEDIRDVCKGLRLEYAELHGEIKDRESEIHKFTNDENCKVLIGHPGSGGIGVNLVAASYSIFYSRSFSLEFDIQAEARNYRGGSERHESVTRIDLVTPGTIDEVVLKALADKVAISDSILKQHLQEL